MGGLRETETHTSQVIVTCLQPPTIPPSAAGSSHLAIRPLRDTPGRQPGEHFILRASPSETIAKEAGCHLG